MNNHHRPQLSSPFWSGAPAPGSPAALSLLESPHQTSLILASERNSGEQPMEPGTNDWQTALQAKIQAVAAAALISPPECAMPICTAMLDRRDTAPPPESDKTGLLPAVGRPSPKQLEQDALLAEFERNLELFRPVFSGLTELHTRVPFRSSHSSGQALAVVHLLWELWAAILGMETLKIPLAGKPPRPRRNMSVQVRTFLDTYFSVEPRPKAEEVCRICEATGLSKRRVREWFSARLKADGAEKEETDADTTTASTSLVDALEEFLVQTKVAADPLSAINAPASPCTQMLNRLLMPESGGSLMETPHLSHLSDGTVPGLLGCASPSSSRNLSFSAASTTDDTLEDWIHTDAMLDH